MEHLSEIVMTVIAFAALIGQWMTDLHTCLTGTAPQAPKHNETASLPMQGL
ncbi:MAG: hypothetical protein AABZ34_16475 [Nitrospirota bacterium]